VRFHARYLLVALVIAALAPSSAAAAVRDADPVVLEGAQVGQLLGAAPARIVAFRWSDGWRQVPVQVDERAVVHIGNAYGPTAGVYGAVPVPVLTYTDAATFIGPDPDPLLDANDEIALMARDSGGRARGGRDPSGVQAGSGVEIAVRDPLAADQRSYLYLFRTSGERTPAAGRDYVDYDFALASGDYKTTYGLASGPNPEDSWIRTASYSHHFADRWLSDQLRITTAGASGVDILDRHKFLFAPGSCGRSEDTFDAGEGAFVVNRDGPVRAIRSYVGANSGPYVQRTHVFYEGREDIVTNLRVHDIGGGMDFFDYSPTAAGMTYRNNVNTSGVPIDGVPETLQPIYHPWESVAGPQGSLTIVHRIDTDIPSFGMGSFWLDQATPSTNPNSPEFQCTGDPSAYGQSGPRMLGPIPNTDPRLGPSKFVRTTRHLYFGEPAGANGPQRLADAFFPLQPDTRPRARIFTRLKRNPSGPGSRPILLGSTCPAPGASTRVTLERRPPGGSFAFLRNLRPRKLASAACRGFGPVTLTAPGAYRVHVVRDDRQSGGYGRIVRVRRPR
jgi:hypothetical protein